MTRQYIVSKMQLLRNYLDLNSISTRFKNERTRRLAVNSAMGLLYRSGALLISMLQISQLYNVLGRSEYGLWLLIQSVVNWFQFFEFGFSNGLRNKFAEAYSNGNESLARDYLNTAFSSVLLIVTGLMFMFGIAQCVVNWQSLFRTTHILTEEQTQTLVLFSVLSLLGLLVLQVFNGVIHALQQNRYISRISFITQFAQFVLVYICVGLNQASLLNIAFILCFVPVLIQGVMVRQFFRTHLGISYIDLRLADYRRSSELVSTSIKFLILNLTGVVLYTTDNILIADMFSPADVSTYNIIYKYFGLPNVLFGILTAPLWSAFTEAYTQRDAGWIRSTLRRITFFCAAFACVHIVLLVSSNVIYKWWIGPGFLAPDLLNISMMLFFLIQLCLQGYVALLNGTGYLKAQMIHSIAGAVLNIPLSVFLAEYLQIGPAGVILATLTTQVAALFWLPRQIKTIIDSCENT